jgi:hypothetical protein
MSNEIITKTADLPRFSDLMWELEYEFMGTPVLVEHRRYRGETEEQIVAATGAASVQTVPFAKVLRDPEAIQSYLLAPR